jgi:choline dehydrogenase-like flavoprotein
MDLGEFDVAIVGSGIAGAIIARELGEKGKRVLLIEAGVGIPSGREAMLERYFLSSSKLPETPFEENPNAPSAAIKDLINGGGYLDQRDSPKPFGSTWERRAGGTMWHWMGTSLRFMPNDFALRSRYGHGVDWPIKYDDLGLVARRADGSSYYDLAEREIGVSADRVDQTESPYRPGYEYPNPGIPLSRVDQFFKRGLGEGFPYDDGNIRVIPTPAGRNSRFYDNRRACAGNTNCVPICPIQAKYDATVTLHKAFRTGHVTALFQHVARRILVDPISGAVNGIVLVRYDDPTRRSPTGEVIVRAKRYVIAANAVETPRLLLMSGLGDVNPHIGRYLMDHPFYLRWGLAPKPIFPYRGPLSTAGLDSLRDGPFRAHRAAYRIEIGNDGWLLPMGGPYQTVLDLVDKTNVSYIHGNSPAPTEPIFGTELLDKLNDHLTRQCRIGFELEQLPLAGNRVTLSDLVDNLGLPKPKITYSYSDYEYAAIASAGDLAERLFSKLGIVDFSKDALKPQRAYDDKCNPKQQLIMGAGHVIGTVRMGTDKSNSVVDRTMRSWDCRNLFLVGSGVFPTAATANPTLTLAALSFWAADTILEDLAKGGDEIHNSPIKQSANHQRS